jgi:GTP-binding protein EngB required for normal cell division
MNQHPESLLGVVRSLASKYSLRPLGPSIAACEALARDATLNIAVFGRFKAGKSSFLNQIIGEQILPAGVTPVTAVVSEIIYGPHVEATVHFLDGRSEHIAIERLREFIAETENPENAKGVARVAIELPSLEKYRGIRFLDTPGLESTLAHNTEVAKEWLPSAGLAIVTVGVDPPLSERDVALIRELSAQTPRLCVLLTKADLLSRPDLATVVEFVRKQLAKHFPDPPRVFPYSVRPGYEDLRASFETSVLQTTVATIQSERQAILQFKLRALGRECQGYLELALKAIQSREAEQDNLRRMEIEGQTFEEEAKLQFRMVAQHARGAARSEASNRLEPHLKQIEMELLNEFPVAFEQWNHSLAQLVPRFEGWIAAALKEKISRLSAEEEVRLLAPLSQVRVRMEQILRDIHGRLKDLAARAYGVELELSPIELRAQIPRKPDIHVSHVFDTYWELFSPVTPMFLIRGMVCRHLSNRKIPNEVYKNISRLIAQWEETTATGVTALQREAESSLTGLLETLRGLLNRADSDAPELQSELEKLQTAMKEVAGVQQ